MLQRSPSHPWESDAPSSWGSTGQSLTLAVTDTGPHLVTRVAAAGRPPGAEGGILSTFPGLCGQHTKTGRTGDVMRHVKACVLKDGAPR